jgi:hypothetical protein
MREIYTGCSRCVVWMGEVHHDVSEQLSNFSSIWHQ